MRSSLTDRTYPPLYSSVSLFSALESEKSMASIAGAGCSSALTSKEREQQLPRAAGPLLSTGGLRGSLIMVPKEYQPVPPWLVFPQADE